MKRFRRSGPSSSAVVTPRRVLARGLLRCSGLVLLCSVAAAGEEPVTTTPPPAAASDALPLLELSVGASAARYWERTLPSYSVEQHAFDPFLDALTGGKPWIQLRFRGETVDQDGIAKQGTAFTLRSVVGYETLPYEGFTGLVEFVNVSNAGPQTYNDTINGKDRPVIADPSLTDLNRAFVRRAITESSEIKAGRQRILLDNQRFVGNVGWRQNEQTFDAVVLKGEPSEEVDLFYGYVGNANRVVGPDSPNGDAHMHTHLVNASTQTGAGKLVGYWYYLDYNQSATPGLSSSTVGVRLTGDHPVDEETKLLYAFDLATQDDAAENPNHVSARYYSAEVGVGVGAVTVKAGREVLGGDANDATDVFSTPLATLHAFNGWADKFLVTPIGGLQDTWLALEGKLDEQTKLGAVLHDFAAQDGGGDYGTELDLQFIRKLSERVTWGAKAAFYDARDFATDTEKFWLWIQLN